MKCVNCLNLYCFTLTNSKKRFTSFYLEIFSRHTLLLSLCSLVLRFLIIQWLPFHSTSVRGDIRWPPLFLQGKFFSFFLKPLFKFKLKRAYAYHIWRLWCIGSYTIMAKPMKSLELHYPMIQFLINRFIASSLYPVFNK